MFLGTPLIVGRRRRDCTHTSAVYDLRFCDTFPINFDFGLHFMNKGFYIEYIFMKMGDYSIFFKKIKKNILKIGTLHIFL